MDSNLEHKWEQKPPAAQKITILMISIAACQESLQVRNHLFETLNHAAGHVYVLCAVLRLVA